MFPIPPTPPPYPNIYLLNILFPTLLTILYTDVIGVVMYVFGMSMDKKREISSFQTEKKMGLFYKLMFFYERPSKNYILGNALYKMK